MLGLCRHPSHLACLFGISLGEKRSATFRRSQSVTPPVKGGVGLTLSNRLVIVFHQFSFFFEGPSLPTPPPWLITTIKVAQNPFLKFLADRLEEGQVLKNPISNPNCFFCADTFRSWIESGRSGLCINWIHFLLV